ESVVPAIHTMAAAPTKIRTCATTGSDSNCSSRVDGRREQYPGRYGWGGIEAGTIGRSSWRNREPNGRAADRGTGGPGDRPQVVDAGARVRGHLHVAARHHRGE